MKDNKTNSEQIFNRPPRRTSFLGPMVGKLPTSGGGGGTTDYDRLSNKPSINNVTLMGNKTAADLGLASATAINDKQNIVDTSLETTEKRIVPAINEVVGNLEYVAQEIGYVSDDLLTERTQRQSADSVLQTEKQDKTDNSLQTTTKTIVGAINELHTTTAEEISEINDKLQVLADEAFIQINELAARIDKMEIEIGGLYASTINYTAQELHDKLGYGTWENICDENNRDYLYLKAISYDSAQNPGGGNVSEQTLPNVSANLNIYGDSGCGYMSGSSTDQALYPGETSQAKYMQASSSQINNARHNIRLDLSRGNSVYRDDANVHPTNYSVYLYRRVA